MNRQRRRQKEIIERRRQKAEIARRAALDLYAPQPGAPFNPVLPEKAHEPEQPRRPD